jgi:uncharacterized protein
MSPIPARAAPGHKAWSSLPQRAGIGLKAAHFDAVHRERPDVGFFEIHAENFLVAGGPLHAHLTRIRSHYPLSIHGVGLSIGGEQPLNTTHLASVAALVKRYDAAVFSEHLAWSSHAGQYLNDLLPVAYNLSTLQRVCAHVDQVQNALGRPMLLENPSSYLSLRSSTWSEGDFLAEVLHRTGCGLLLDVNNVYVSATNLRQSPLAWLRSLPLKQAGHIHLAGFAEQADTDGGRLLIDTHGARVHDEVWHLYETALRSTGALPTLLERDNHVPALNALVQEAHEADTRMRLLCAPQQEPA